MMYNTKTNGSSRREILRRVVAANVAAGSVEVRGLMAKADLAAHSLFETQVDMIPRFPNICSNSFSDIYELQGGLFPARE